jgi:phosphatidate cytidylyltransferase
VLKRRLISAAIIISIMVVLLWADHYLGRPEVLGKPGLLLAGVTTLTAVLAAGELVRMWRAAGVQGLSYVVSLGGSLLLCAGAFLPIYWPGSLQLWPIGVFGGTLFGLFAAIVAAAAHEMWWFDQPGSEVERLSRQVFSFAYLAMLVGMVVPHRLMIGLGPEEDRNGSGICAVLAVMVAVKLSDTFAYMFGKLWGRRKLAPLLSPNKTIEGAAGSFVGAIVGAALVFYLVAWFVADDSFFKPFWWVVVYGIVVAAAGMLGDLAESLVKRDAKCKDSSGWLAGLGGVLDIIDSLIFAAPASYLVWLLLP